VLYAGRVAITADAKTMMIAAQEGPGGELYPYDFASASLGPVLSPFAEDIQDVAHGTIVVSDVENGSGLRFYTQTASAPGRRAASARPRPGLLRPLSG
jgi:hypothetical protein